MYAEDSHTCNSKKEALNFYVPFSYQNLSNDHTEVLWLIRFKIPLNAQPLNDGLISPRS